MKNSSKTNTKAPCPLPGRFSLAFYYDDHSPVAERTLRRLNRWALRYKDICEILVFYARPIHRIEIVKQNTNLRWFRLEDKTVQNWPQYAAQVLSYVTSDVTVFYSSYAMSHFHDILYLANAPIDGYNACAVSLRKRPYYGSGGILSPIFVFLRFHKNKIRSLFVDLARKSALQNPVLLFSCQNHNLKTFLKTGGVHHYSRFSYGASGLSPEILESIAKSKEKLLFLPRGKGISFFQSRVGIFTSYRLIGDYLNHLIHKKKADSGFNGFVWLFPAVHLSQVLIFPVLLIYPPGVLGLFLFMFLLFSVYAKNVKALKFPAFSLIKALFFWFFI